MHACTGGVASQLSESERDRLVAKTEGYSGSDMRNLIQEACQGPIRDAVAAATNCAALQHMSEADLRAVMLRDFQVGRRERTSWAEQCRVLCKASRAQSRPSAFRAALLCNSPQLSVCRVATRAVAQHFTHAVRALY